MGYNLKNKAVVLTGGSRGIGRAVAVKLAEEGARLAIIARDEAKLSETAELVEATGGFVVTVVGDVTDDDSVATAVARAAAELEGIDTFMNIAGITLEKSIEDATPEDYQHVMDTNLMGVVRCTKCALPHLKKSRGFLVNIASVIISNPFPWLGVYACSKWAVAAFSHTIRQELYGSGIRVLTVYPTVVRTDMADEEPVLANTPTQSPEQCAKAIVKAIKKGKVETGTAWLPKLSGAIFSIYPPLTDWINRLFLPRDYKERLSPTRD